ncbi:pantothenate transporter liz1 [Moniliophthora roreri MCA 2997]|uniref:Pantothenate transporter liz1 n=1 Tax=Moniliophthora roreri (strain MCA 2997) TaxID=1381753 RepID=V2XWV1_MONRO|nr:pantothenate transporter liz1 [Moniliophthora roreri MCA 2997]
MAPSVGKVAEAPQNWTLWQKFKTYIWDADAHLKTPFERKLMRKLDFGILVVACLGFFMRYLDAANLANAYVSGMKEDLNITGNEYTYMGTCYTIAYAIFQIPGTLIVTRVRPSIYLFICEIGWGAFTFAQAGAKNSNQMYAFRFCVGAFEASFFPSILYLMGSWYNKHELAKRSAIFHLCGSLGSSFGGYLQAAVYTTLNGAHGIPGWRWLYIVCGCMTIPCGVALLFILPDLPSNTRAWYLTKEEKGYALERAIGLGKAQPGEKRLNLDLIKRMLCSWRWYGLVLGYTIYGTSCQATGFFGIWMKAAGYSVVDRNVIPSCQNLISAFCIFLWGFGSDLTGSRFAFVFGPLAYGLIPNGILAFWPGSRELKLFAFMTGGVQLMTAVFYSWANELLADDNDLRALTISSMNGFQYSVSAWLPIIIFPQTMAPDFRRGFPATFAFVIAGLITIVIIKLLVDRDARRATLLDEKASVPGDKDSQDSKTEDVERLSKKADYDTVKP